MRKFSRMIMICFILLATIFAQLVPVLAMGETTSSTSIVSSSSTESLAVGDEQETSETSSHSVEMNSSENDDGKSGVESSSFEETTEKELVNKNSIENAMLRSDISSRLVVTDWRITNAVNQEISDTQAAVSNQAYDFSFEALVGPMNAGDTFAIDIPQVQSSSSLDHWLMQSSEWVVQKDDEENDIYRYRIQHKEGTNTQEIQFEALRTSGSSLVIGHTFPGMLLNFVKTAGVFPVTFGSNSNGEAFTKQLKFEIGSLNMANGFSFKFNSAASNNSATWGIQFNGAGNLELAGDEVDYSVNGGTGNPYQGFYRDNPLRKPENWHQWGSNYTDIWTPEGNNQSVEANYGGYVEDELPANAEVTQLTIAGYINLPLGLSEKNGETQTGGIPATQAAFQSYVLADYGKGPVYRNDGNTGILRPKENTGFVRLEQGPGETKAAFKQKIQSQPYLYGIYEDGAGRKTVMIHFGNMKKTGNQQAKFSDLTDTKYSGKSFTDKDGVIHQIPQFAVEAATASINDQRSGYTEADRELLEKYFTLVYGDENAIHGSIAAYNISLHVRYPPSVSGEVSNTSNIYTHSALTLGLRNPTQMPKKDSASATLKNPRGHISISKTEVLLQKLDAERFSEAGDYLAINGAEFKLQKKVADEWVDITDGNTAKLWTTADFPYLEEGESKAMAGVIKVDISTLGNLPGGVDGTYRFVETKAPPGYSDKDSPNWSNQDQAIVSEEFSIPSTTSQGPSVTVWNRHKKVTYKVEHYVQKNDVADPELTDFDLAETEEFAAEVGDIVSAQPLDRLQVEHYYNQSYSMANGLISGEIPDDGELVLKLYYTKDESVPFTIYKLDVNGNPMKSTEEHNVTFKAYSFSYKNGTKVEDIPLNDQNIQDGYWRRTVIENENTLAYTTDMSDPREELVLTVDEQGRIRDKRISRSSIGGTIALVEVTNTHPGYTAPTMAENYWVLGISEKTGQLSSGNGYGSKAENPVKYIPEGTNNSYYAIKNKLAITPNLYKVDENNQPMPSESGKEVTFDVYEYIGADDIRPDKVTNNLKDQNNPLSTTYQANWQKVNETGPCHTDSEGKLVDNAGNPLTLDENKVYSLIETSTYPGYQKPNNQYFSKNRTSHWLISLSGQLETGPSGYVDSRPSQWLAPMYETGAGYSVDAEGIILKNRKLTDIPIFKVDENLNPIHQNSADNFKFETYLFDRTTASNDYKKYPLTNGLWKKIAMTTLADSFSTSGSGRLFSENQELENMIGRSNVVTEQIVAIREVQGMHDYISHSDGYWVVILKWDESAKVNKVTSIEYFTGFENGEAQEAVLENGETQEDNRYYRLLNDQAYLKNTRVPTFDFSFIKEDEKQEPISGAEFVLYTAKNNTGSENPNDPNTKWDLTEEPYREAVSSADPDNKGQVEFQKLASGEYLLIETKTIEGYQLPQGYWVLTINAENETVDIRGSTDSKPPAFRKADETYYLPNYPVTLLPLSGGVGKLLLTSLGIVLIGLSIIFKLTKRKGSIH